VPDIYNYYRVERTIAYLSHNFRAQPDLAEIAQNVHVSPFHLHRIFTDWVGISPKQFLQHLTIDYLKAKLSVTANMIEAAEIAGLSSQSRVHDLFVTIEGVSPMEYKTGGRQLVIYYGYHASPFGLCFIAIAKKGICALKFIDEERTRDEYELFSQQWPLAKLVHKPSLTQSYVQVIFGKYGRCKNLKVLVKGTDFQIQVWRALLRIPYGNLASFHQVARMINQPNATRAVARAVASNVVLYLIPCHRIISEAGHVGDYHYGRARKQAMTGWEMVHARHLSDAHFL
jgi:AraC family transcriptional regulator of adaptative response/methylated-DNA-[protein]-cysteine methyltransferase